MQIGCAGTASAGTSGPSGPSASVGSSAQDAVRSRAKGREDRNKLEAIVDRVRYTWEVSYSWLAEMCADSCVQDLKAGDGQAERAQCCICLDMLNNIVRCYLCSALVCNTCLPKLDKCPMCQAKCLKNTQYIPDIWKLININDM